MFSVGNPVGQGFVADLARPGGNVTGLSAEDHGLLVKQFGLLQQAVPRARRIGVVFNPGIPAHALGLRGVEAAAQRTGVQIHPLSMGAREEVDGALEALQRERVEAAHFFLQPILNTGDTTRRIAAQALQRRWPTAMADLPHVRAGILLGYGGKIEDMLRRLPYYVIRILEGALPGELPVEQPTRFYLSLNLKTAKALGVTLSQSLLLRADEVIE
jgi:putative ABC transport system substrate-binding protein